MSDTQWAPDYTSTPIAESSIPYRVLAFGGGRFIKVPRDTTTMTTTIMNEAGATTLMHEDDQLIPIIPIGPIGDAMRPEDV